MLDVTHAVKAAQDLTNKTPNPTSQSVPPHPQTLKLVLPKIKKLTENQVLLKNLETALAHKNGQALKAVERGADKLIDFLSKPAAIWGQTFAVGAYLAINTLAMFRIITFDPYPFLFLNLVFSLVSAYTTVFVLNSNRRQDTHSDNVTKAERAILAKILTDLDKLRRTKDETESSESGSQAE